MPPMVSRPSTAGSVTRSRAASQPRATPPRSAMPPHSPERGSAPVRSETRRRQARPRTRRRHRREEQHSPDAGPVDQATATPRFGDDRRPASSQASVICGNTPEHDHEHAGDDEQRERNVANRLDVDGGQLADDPVRRQAGDADERAEHGGGDDAADRDPQRVEEPLDQRVADRCALRQRVPGDLERGRVVEEAEAGRDVLAAALSV